MKTIAQQWGEFDKAVLLPTAPAIQRTEMRRAFFAGFHSALLSGIEISNVVGDGNDSDDIGANMLENLHRECIAFSADVQAGRA